MSAIATYTFRLVKAFTTIPSLDYWLHSAELLAILAVISLTVGFLFRFIQFDVIKVTHQTLFSIIIGSLFTPAIAEELFFRVLLLPYPTENADTMTLWFWGSIGLIIFIIYHPLNAVTFFPAGRKTFFHPIFLLLAAFLGVTCTISYWQSGSLWPPVVIHWIFVVTWLLLLGGYRKLHE